MFRRIFPALALLVAVLLDTAVVPATPIRWLFPFFAFTCTLAMGLTLGRTRGALFGIFAGLLIDITVSTPVGLMMVLYGLAGLASGLASHVLRRTILFTVISAAACLLVYEAAMLIYSLVAGTDFTAAQLARAGWRVLLNTGLVQLEYLLFGAVLQPRAARYDRR